LYPPTLVSVTETRMDTFKYKPKAFWLVNDPDRVRILDQKANESIASFESIYRMIVTEVLEAMGETGSGVSQVDLMGGDKTATEVRDRAFLRNARDNFNKIMLTSALRRVMYLLFQMLRDPKFTDKNTVVKIVGRDALEYFDKQGFTDWGINDQGYDLVFDTAEQLRQNPDMVQAAKETGTDIFNLAYEILMQEGVLDQFAEPAEPVMTAKGMVSKLEILDDEGEGYLYVDPEEDYQGEYDFRPDIEALGMPDSSADYGARSAWYQQAREVEEKGGLQREGYQLKHKDILTKLAELTKIKEADQYFEKAEVQDGIDKAGTGAPGAIPGGEELPPDQAIQGSPVASNVQPGQEVPGTIGAPPQMG
jgi:hypothetical protein